MYLGLANNEGDGGDIWGEHSSSIGPPAWAHPNAHKFRLKLDLQLFLPLDYAAHINVV
jgi:hypothetical protein